MNGIWVEAGEKIGICGINNRQERVETCNIGMPTFLVHKGKLTSL